MESSFNIFDIVFFSLVGLFSLIGLLRGFVRETFSIVNWIIAGLVAVYTRPILSALILKKVKIEIVADTISNSIAFTTTLIVVSLLTANLSKLTSEKVPVYINNPVGLLFGFLKAYLIMAVVVVTMFSIFEVDEYGNNEEDLPAIVKNAKTYPFVKFGANLARPSTDKFFKEEIPTKDDMINRLLENEAVQKKGVELGINIIKKKLEDKGYTDDQINKMDMLIDVVAD